MMEGRVLGEWFEVVNFVAAGGLGYVYRGTDRSTGEPVAIKISRSLERGVLDRFAREARVLAGLNHPAIVRYLGHGTTDDGEAYVAMEWLQGEDLEARLRRELPTVEQTCILGARVGRALATAHSAGVVHRDIKPSNLFLVGGEWSRGKLIDFGLARLADATMLTMGSAWLGTPAYMSPEQARRDQAFASSDIFSLGLVLFECLTGRRCFAGGDLFEVLARIVLDEIPRPSEARDGVPEHLDALVAAMTHKDPSARPTAADVAGDLEGLLRHDAVGRAPAPPTITKAERRLLAVVVVTPPVSPEVVADDSATTLTDLASPSSPLIAAARGLGAALETLRDGSLLALITEAGAPAELCSRAARLALEVRRMLGSVPIAVATGRAAPAEREPIGELIARAAALVSRRVPGISIDDVSAALLPARFIVEGGLLRGEREFIEPTPLRGRRTLFVGRDRELGVLRGLFDECREESIPRAVLITGAVGIGKSRIANELLAGLRRDGVEIQLLAGAGDPIGAAPFGLLARATRGALGARLSDSSVLTKVDEQVARHFDGEDRRRISHLLAELIGGGTHSPDRAVGGLADPVVLGDRIRVAWQEWVAAMARLRPVVLLLDDLHWGDLATVKVVDLALRNLSDCALMVLALARTEVEKRFPDLWRGREVHEMHLSGLRPRACSALVRELLGETVPAEQVTALIERTGGNPFFLQETIRALARGDAAAPESVLATVQIGLEELPEEGRRVLRAASIFGMRFWVSGIRGLLGDHRDELDEWLAVLTQRELVEQADQSHYAGEEEFLFCHALVRDAAYATLVEPDRVLGHQLVGDWLERVGANDPAVLAEHFYRGGVPDRAATWYLRAAERALEGDDLSLVLDYVERARSCKADAATVTMSDLLEAQAHWWRADYIEGLRAASAAMQGFAGGCGEWFRAARLAVYCALHAGDQHALASRIDDIRVAAAAPDVEAEQATALFAAIEMLYFSGDLDEGDKLMEEARANSGAVVALPAVAAALHAAMTIRSAVTGDFEGSLSASRAAIDCYVAAGDVRGAAFAKNNMGHVYNSVGAFDRAEAILSEALALGRAAGAVAPEFAINLGYALARLGRADVAIPLLHAEIDRNSGGAAKLALLRATLAFAHARTGRIREARTEASVAVTALDGDPAQQSEALAVLADVLLRAGNAEEALESCERALHIMDAHRITVLHDGLLRLVRVLSLVELGREQEADRVLLEAREGLLARAENIHDPELRCCFLANLEEHVRILELASERRI